MCEELCVIVRRVRGRRRELLVESKKGRHSNSVNEWTRFIRSVRFCYGIFDCVGMSEHPRVSHNHGPYEISPQERFPHDQTSFKETGWRAEDFRIIFDHVGMSELIGVSHNHVPCEIVPKKKCLYC